MQPRYPTTRSGRCPRSVGPLSGAALACRLPQIIPKRSLRCSAPRTRSKVQEPISRLCPPTVCDHGGERDNARTDGPSARRWLIAYLHAILPEPSARSCRPSTRVGPKAFLHRRNPVKYGCAAGTTAGAAKRWRSSTPSAPVGRNLRCISCTCSCRISRSRTCRGTALRHRSFTPWPSGHPRSVGRRRMGGHAGI